MPVFTNEISEDQRGKVSCPQSHSQEWGGLSESGV